MKWLSDSMPSSTRIDRSKFFAFSEAWASASTKKQSRPWSSGNSGLHCAMANRSRSTCSWKSLSISAKEPLLHLEQAAVGMPT